MRWLLDYVPHRPFVANLFGRIQGRIQDRLRRPAFLLELVGVHLRPIFKFLRPIQTDGGRQVAHRNVLAQPIHVLLVADFVEYAGLDGIQAGDLLDDRLNVRRQVFPVAVVDRQAVPGDGAEADGGVVLADFMQLENRTPGAGEHDAAFGDAGFDLLVPAGKAIGHRNDAHVGLLHPVKVEPGAEDFVALEVGRGFPGEIGAEVVPAVADNGEQGLAIFLEMLFKARELLVDGPCWQWRRFAPDPWCRRAA